MDLYYLAKLRCPDQTHFGCIRPALGVVGAENNRRRDEDGDDPRERDRQRDAVGASVLGVLDRTRHRDEPAPKQPAICPPIRPFIRLSVSAIDHSRRRSTT